MEFPDAVFENQFEHIFFNKYEQIKQKLNASSLPHQSNLLPKLKEAINEGDEIKAAIIICLFHLQFKHHDYHLISQIIKETGYTKDIFTQHDFIQIKLLEEVALQVAKEQRLFLNFYQLHEICSYQVTYNVINKFQLQYQNQLKQIAYEKDRNITYFDWYYSNVERRINYSKNDDKLQPFDSIMKAYQIWFQHMFKTAHPEQKKPVYMLAMLKASMHNVYKLSKISTGSGLINLYKINQETIKPQLKLNDFLVGLEPVIRLIFSSTINGILTKEDFMNQPNGLYDYNYKKYYLSRVKAVFGLR